MDILLKAPFYLIATNSFLVPKLPIIFGKHPGDEYYSAIKYFFFFVIILLITNAIFYTHNGRLANNPDTNAEIENCRK